MTMEQIPKRQLGRNGPMVSAIGLGAMSIGAFYGETDVDEAFKALTLSADVGMTFWDTADVYGNTEEVLGRWFSETGRRNEIFLCTKFGSRDMFDTSGVTKRNAKPSYIRKALRRSLEILKTDSVDLYYLHRVDVNVPIEVVIDTLGEFIESGEVKWIGLSECGIDTLKRAKAVPNYGEKVIALQNEYSPLTLDVEKNGTLATARELGIAIVAYSPLSRGLLGGDIRAPSDFKKGDLRDRMPRFSGENFEKNVQISDKFKQLGVRYNATGAQIILAWILAEHSDFIPIPGCRSRARVQENAAAALIKLADEDIKEIRRMVDALQAHGERYPEMYNKDIGADTLPLKEWKGE